MTQTAVKLDRNGATPALNARSHSSRMLARTRARIGAPAGPGRGHLRIVDGTNVTRQAWFALAMVSTLVGGLLLTLLVNTRLAEGSYTRSRLVVESSRLTDQQQALTDELDALRAPAALASRALSLGMVSAASPAFVSLARGIVLGKADAATPADAFPVITAPTLPPPGAAGTTDGSAAGGATTGGSTPSGAAGTAADSSPADAGQTGAGQAGVSGAGAPTPDTATPGTAAPNAATPDATPKTQPTP
ncbi:MAG: septum formation initiator family protein [Tetrasphaera sp.]|jgi:hypothetical protein|nr:septum formation initiator family protein [Tetrasphaera sp.]